MPTRREFLSQTTIASGALALGATRMAIGADKPLRMLVLGGTGYIGPYFVRAALARGHKVAVFSRGKSDVDLPRTIERLIGDRDGDLRSIENRTWDAVLDLATYGPAWVRSLGEALQRRVGHYTFISTGDVYKDSGSNVNGTDEQSATVDYDVGIDPYSHSFTDIDKAAIGKYCDKDESPKACLLKSSQYGSLKVLCEKEAEKQFPGKTLIVRPGYMVGAGDAQARFTYWLARLERGGEILAPGDPLQQIQFIDVRDVAEWVIRMTEQTETGVYNAVGPGNSMSMCEMLGGIRSLFGTPMKLTWVSIPWIMEQDVVDPEALEWSIWRFSQDAAYKTDKAIAKGLTYRPLSVTAKDILEWYKSQSIEKRQSFETDFKIDDLPTLKTHPVVTPWTEILRRETEILTHWRAHRTRIQ